MWPLISEMLEYYKQNPSHKKQYLKHAVNILFTNCTMSRMLPKACNNVEQYCVEMLLISFSRFLSSWQKRDTVYTLKPLGNWKWALCCSCHWNKQFWSHLGCHINVFDNKLLEGNSQQLLLNFSFVALGCRQTFSALKG